MGAVKSVRLMHSLDLIVGLLRLRSPSLNGSSAYFRYLHLMSSSTPKRDGRNSDAIASSTPSKTFPASLTVRYVAAFSKEPWPRP